MTEPTEISRFKMLTAVGERVSKQFDDDIRDAIERACDSGLNGGMIIGILASWQFTINSEMFERED